MLTLFLTLSMLLLSFCYSSQNAYEGPFRSFIGNEKCSSIQNVQNTTASSDFQCDSLQGPATWVKTEQYLNGAQNYDLIIVGAGVAGAYAVSRILDIFRDAGQRSPNIALFERSGNIGGRLMSSYIDGALSLGAVPANDDFIRSPTPILEYGGMRIDPIQHPLVYNRIARLAFHRYNEYCAPAHECKEKNCCPSILLRMDVGLIRYATNNPSASAWMRSSTYNTPPAFLNGRVQDGYTLEAIAAGIGSPFDTCCQLVTAAEAYYVTGHGDTPAVPLPEDRLLVTAMKKMCDECDLLAGLCNLCAKFEGTEAEAVISCSGYDLSVTKVPFFGFINFFDQVIDLKGNTRLFLVKAGLQSFVQSMLSGHQWHLDEPQTRTPEAGLNDNYNVAPSFEKVLKNVKAMVGGKVVAKSTYQLVNEQIVGNNTMTADAVEMNFADGTRVTGNTGLITALPYDLMTLDGFGPYEKEYEKLADNPTGLIKLAFFWTNKTEALPNRLGVKSCDEGLCERLILDTRLVRQLWMWSPTSVLLYSADSVGDRASSDRLAQMLRTEGIDKTVKAVFDQIREVLQLPDLENPDIARVKFWPYGTIVDWNTNNDTVINEFVDKIQQPLGDGIPLFYANSEIAQTDSYHGWTEGALESIEAILPALTAKLGLVTPMDTYNPDDIPQPPPSSSGGKTLDTSTRDLIWSAVAGCFVGVLCITLLNFMWKISYKGEEEKQVVRQEEIEVTEKDEVTKV